MADAINEAIAKARAAAEQPAQAPAAEATANTASVPAAALGATAAVAAVTGRPQSLSAQDMMQGSFSVDVFAKVSEDGIKIGDSGLIEKMRVSVDLREVFYYFGIRYGNPATYKKTVDRVKTLDGMNWADALALAAKVDPKFRGEYRAADIPMVLLEDVKDIKGKDASPAGTRVGKSLSTTEWREWESLLRAAMKQNVNIENAVLELNVGYRARSNKEGNKWGVLTFELVGEYADEGEQQAA